MGGAASSLNKTINSGLASIPVIGKTASFLEQATPWGAAGNAIAAVDRGIQGVQTLQRAPADAAAALEKQKAADNVNAAALQQQIASRPQAVGPNDSVAEQDKARKLAALKYGMASTVQASGAMGAPAAATSSPSLVGGGSKTSLGA